MEGLGTPQDILEACRRATPIPITYDDKQPLTQAERINVFDLAHTFSAFKVVAGTESCLGLCEEMADGKCATPMGFLYGGVGNGKTHLLEAMVIRLNERGLFTRYHTWTEVVASIRNCIHNDRADWPSADVMLDRWCRVPRLVIDDLGMGTTDTEWELSCLENIIGFRYRAKLFTAIATNKDIKQLPPRVMSRLQDREYCTMALNKGPDFRSTKKRHVDRNEG